MRPRPKAEGRALENMPPEGRDVGHALKPAKGERALERGSRGREREREGEGERKPKPMVEGREPENMLPGGSDVGQCYTPAKGVEREGERAKGRESHSPWSRGEHKKTCCLGAAM